MKALRTMTLSAAALFLTSVLNLSAQQPAKTGMDRSRLNIGTYFLQEYASTEKHVKDLADCGIDFVVCMRNDPATLDLFQKYHVGAVVTGIFPGWWGGDGKSAGTMAQHLPLSVYEEAYSKFKSHPAVWGIDIGDEPSALDFEHYGKVLKRVNELCAPGFAYLNLYPNYASVAKNTVDQTASQLGTSSYTKYIADYCRYVPSDYICYDFYIYSINVQKAYENLRIVSDACLGTGRSMWIVLQVNSNKKEEWISENELRFQAHTAMAFGAESIIWACYTAGWWHNQVLDTLGNKTQQYDKLKKVDAELHSLGQSYMKYRRVSTAFVGYKGTEWLEGVGQAPCSELNDGIFTNLCAADGTPLLAGSMVSRSGDGRSAIFVVSTDDPYDKNPAEHTVRFKTDRKTVTAVGGNGPVKVKKADGFYEIKIKSSQAVLIEAAD